MTDPSARPDAKIKSTDLSRQSILPVSQARDISSAVAKKVSIDTASIGISGIVKDRRIVDLLVVDVLQINRMREHI